MRRRRDKNRVVLLLVLALAMAIFAVTIVKCNLEAVGMWFFVFLIGFRSC